MYEIIKLWFNKSSRAELWKSNFKMIKKENFEKGVINLNNDQ